MTETTLAGKVALVTGAGRRLGAAIVQQLHASGATVVIHYRSSEPEALQLQALLNAQRSNSCFLVSGDLLKVECLPEIITTVLEQTGRLDILVNNASSFYPTPLGMITAAMWDDLVGTNMKVPLFLAQAAMQALHETQGCIVNMIDVHGIRPLPEHTVYSAAKAGLRMLTQSLAREMGPTVRVNGIAPGAILWPEQTTNGPDNKQQQAAILAKTALGRSGTPDDIARAVLFLAKDAQYITGQVLPVDGGRLLNH